MLLRNVKNVKKIYINYKKKINEFRLHLHIFILSRKIEHIFVKGKKKEKKMRESNFSLNIFKMLLTIRAVYRGFFSFFFRVFHKFDFQILIKMEFLFNFLFELTAAFLCSLIYRSAQKGKMVKTFVFGNFVKN